MKPDFSGWATKANIQCSDGRTIAPNAFQAQDGQRVPIVYQHGHKDIGNVLGHAILENRPEGVYCYGYLNGTPNAKIAHEALDHKDITMLSIWANGLMQKAGKVIHGAIREVSLVLSGANPGALIESVTVRHSDGGEEELEDEAIIYTGTIEHSSSQGVSGPDEDAESNNDKEGETDIEDDANARAEVLDTLTDDQREAVHSLFLSALEGKGDLSHAAGDETIQDVYESLSDKQKTVVEFMIGQALAQNGMGHDNLGDDDTKDDNTMGKSVVAHNVFDKTDKDAEDSTVLSHDALNEITRNMSRNKSSWKDEVLAYAEENGLQHGIEDIETLFPDAVDTNRTPELNSRRMEWVSSFLGGTTKSPFSRIKTTTGDITFEQARARGYVKGALKKEEWFKVTKRITTPQTVYKKQALDRDDIVDITDFDVVVWIQGEMRMMLDEEIARAGLLGDGRDVDDEDKISEDFIRPIAKESELFATTLNVNLLNANSSIQEVTDAVIMNRKYYKGSGNPTFYTTEDIVSLYLLLKDGFNRPMYNNVAEVANALRVKEIVTVEAMEDDPTLIGVIVNPVDYTFGATKGGEVTTFSDFDIDYNKYKYLIETRLCGALTKIKSALIVRKTATDLTLVVPTAPTFDPDTGELTINDTAHVVYKNADTDATITNGGSPYSVDSGDTINVIATPATGYYFEDSEHDDWSFTAN